MSAAPKLAPVPISQPRLEAADTLAKSARELPADELPDFIGQLESAKAIAWARLMAPASATQPHDALLDVAEAASRLGWSKDYLYRHHAEYPFTRKTGRKLGFSARGIEEHIRGKRT